MAKFDDCEFPSCLGTLVYFKLAEIVRDNQAKISKYGQKIGKK